MELFYLVLPRRDKKRECKARQLPFFLAAVSPKNYCELLFFVDTIFFKIFCIGNVIMSRLMLIAISLVALYVNKIASGANIMVDSQQPMMGGMPFSWATFLPKVLTKWNMIKMSTAKTIGRPSPPFFMMAPSGAPIKNINMHIPSLYFIFFLFLLFSRSAKNVIPF